MAQATKEHKPMKMSQLASASGLSVSTIKFYISQGLLPRPEKSKPNVAFYDDDFLRRLLIIKRMRSESLSIKSMKVILDKYPFKKVSEWEDFKKQAKRKESYELEEEERLATLSDEERRTFAILDAALEVFTAKGYHNATVDDIAQEAGVSKGTCYQYFDGKEDIFVATLDRTLDKIIAEAEAAAEGTKDALTRMGLKGLTFISKFKDMQHLNIGLYGEVMGGNERLRKKAAELQHRISDFLVVDLKIGMEQGVFRKFDPVTVSYALIGIAETVGTRYFFEEDFDVFQFFVGLMDFMQHGLNSPEAAS